MDGELMYFGSEDELRQAMHNPETAREVTDAVLHKRAVIGEKPVEEPVEEVDPVEEDLASPATEETVVEEAPVVDVSMELEEQNRKLKEMYDRDFKEREEALKKQMAEIQAKNEELERLAKEKELKEVMSEPIVDLDEEDPELASTYSRNTRKLYEAQIDQLAKKIENPTVMQEIEALKAKIAADEKKAQEEEARKEAEKRNKELYRTLDSFANGKPEFAVNGGVETAKELANNFKVEMASVLGLNTKEDIERTYRRLIKEDSVWARTNKKKLEDANIKLPEDSKNYLNIVEIYELQRGLKFNTVLGKYEDHVMTLDEAYKLANFNTLISKAGVTEAREIQKKLDERQSSAVVLDNSVTASVSGETTYSMDDISKAVKMAPADLIKDKVMATKYANYLKDRGLKVPPILQNI